MSLYIAKTFQGLETALAEELTALGATVTALHNRAVNFEADLAMLYKANLHLRTALRIIRPVHETEVVDETDLYKAVQQVNWVKLLRPEHSIAVFATSNRAPKLTHTQFIALKTKDAIVDQIRSKTQKRPNVDLRDPDYRIFVHIFKRKVTIAIDSSGESLHKRGYRVAHHPAPLNEVLAAGMLHLSGWTPDKTLVDPMCGSGTLLIEAAQKAMRVPANIRRSRFGFKAWRNYDEALWKEVRKAAKKEIIMEPEVKLIGSDINRRFVDAARQNAEKANVAHILRLSSKDFFERQAPQPAGIILCNPPYGERIEAERDLAAMYARIGDTLKQKYTGYNAWFISSNQAAMKRLGLRPSEKHALFNGPLACKFVGIELYEGSKKTKYEEEL